MNDYTNILTFFAHPDDETLAAGATISRFTRQGSKVSVAIPSTGIKSRRNTLEDDVMTDDLKQLRANCVDALSILGVSENDIYLGEFPDNEMDKHTLLEAVHWFEEIVKKVKPDLVLTHHRHCTNIDHQYCYNAAVVALRPGINQRIPVLCGEVPSSTGYIHPTGWEPDLYIEVSEMDVYYKVRAMQTYKGEARPDPHPRSPEVLKALAKVRGSESGTKFAEAFMVQRMYW